MVSQAQEDKDLVEGLCEIEEGLNEWEVEFVESVAKWVEEHDLLTDKQRTIAKRIYAEKG